MSARDRLIASLLCLASFALYAFTLCPDLYWFDSAEFVNDAVLFDIPHPPGYPLYNLLAHLFTRLPFGIPPWRVNLLSAVLAAAAIAAFYRASRGLGSPAPLAAAAAVLLAASPQFWELAVVAEVYGLEALLVALAFGELARLDAGDGPLEPRAVAPFALFCGLALFHRPTVIVFVAPWIALGWRRVASPGRVLATMALGAAPYLTTAAIFFGRTQVAPGMEWSMNYFDFPRTIKTFLQICTGTLYAGNLGLLAPGELGHEIAAYFSLAVEQLGALVVGLGLLAAIRAATGGGPRAARHAAVLFAGNVAFFLFYNALEKDTMYVPSFLALLWLAQAAVFEAWDSGRWSGLLAAATLAWALVLGGRVGPGVSRRGYHEVRRAVDSTMRLLPPNASLYLTDDLIIHPFLYVRILEGQRRDVQVQIVDGYGAEVQKGLSGRLATRMPVFSTLFYPEATFREVQRGHRLIPRGFLYELVDGPAPLLPAMPAALSKALPGAAVAGAAVFPKGRPLRRSDQLQVVVTWQLEGAADPAACFRLATPDGRHALSWTHRIGYQGRVKQGTRMTEEYLLKVPWDLPPDALGQARLTLGVVPSIAAAAKDRRLSIGNVKDWNERVFFKAGTAGFIRAIERGWPVYAEVLTLEAPMPTETLDLGPVDLVY